MELQGEIGDSKGLIMRGVIVSVGKSKSVEGQ